MEEIRARVTGQERDLYRLSSDRGEKLAEVSGKYQYNAAMASDYPAVGDYVTAAWPEDDSRAVITMLFPRKSCFIRKAAGRANREQVVAANVDVVFICMSMNRDFNLRRIERYLSVAWESGAEPVIVLTKSDLCEDIPGRAAEVESIAMGAKYHVVSSYRGDFDSLRTYLQPGVTAAFLGSSGVGKSTLINSLLGEDLIATGGIRTGDDKGRHTTTHRELVCLDNGAFLIDTPGMRELGMWDSDSGIETAFADIEELAAACRFSNCSHTGEPGCAIRRALESGELDEARWSSYGRLKKENEFAAKGGSYLTAKKEKFKQIAKINKRNRR